MCSLGSVVSFHLRYAANREKRYVPQEEAGALVLRLCGWRQSPVMWSVQRARAKSLLVGP